MSELLACGWRASSEVSQAGGQGVCGRHGTNAPCVSYLPQFGPLWAPSWQEVYRISSSSGVRVSLSQSLPALLRKQSMRCLLGRAGGFGVHHAWPTAWLSTLHQSAILASRPISLGFSFCI